MAHISYANYPLNDIPQPHPHDVLCGRGGGTNNHIGNSHWRMLVAANKQLYISLPKRQKMLLSRSIVNAVRSQNPPGRFLQKDTKSNLWFDVGDQRAQEKTSQALREGAPDIRKKVAAATEGNEEENSGEDNENTPDNNDKDLGDKWKKEGEEQASSTVSKNQNDKQIPSVSLLSSSTSGNQQQQQQFPPQLNSTVSGIPPNMMQGMMAQQQMFQQQQQQAAAAAAIGMNNAMMMPTTSMQMYPTMVMNEHGVMVPGMAMMTPQQQQMMTMMMNNNAAMMNQQGMMSPQVSEAGSTLTQTASNMGHNSNTSGSSQQRQEHFQQHQQQPQQRQQHGDSFEPLPVNPPNDDQKHHHDDDYGRDGNVRSLNVANQTKHATPTFDEFIAAAPEGLDTGGLSYGSIAMTDGEMKRLQATTALGMNRNSYLLNNNYNHNNNPNTGSYSQTNQRTNSNEPLPAAMDGLEPTGYSFGDVSMTSVGTNNNNMRLEDTGTSFGTMMSYNTMKDMTGEGLLEAVGTSFGSLSLDANNRESLFRTLELAASGPEIPPMFHSEEKATGNLLDCSDTESESSEQQEKLTQQKSQAWERMKSQIATETNNTKQQPSKAGGGGSGSVDSQDLMPPPVGIPKQQPQLQQQQQQQQGPSHPGNTSFVDTQLTVPTTALENNFSTLSAWSAADDFDVRADNDTLGDAAPPPPPQPLSKEDSW